MIIHVITVFSLALIGHTSAQSTYTWNGTSYFQNLFGNEAEKMRKFFEDQRNKVEQAFNASYQGAMDVGNSMNNYFDQQQRRLSAEVNSYVESAKESGRKAADYWSFLPNTDDASSRLENPELVQSVTATIARHGYDVETHTVVSQGYVLGIHRIPRAKNTRDVPSQTVLLQHGIFASSADWIMNGPEKSLAYVLANAGYDVWMANIRGNKYSREHLVWKTDSKHYWNFSWHDVAMYDLPAVIDYILRVKGESTKITFIGHSMGTTILFAMLTLKPEYNDKLHAGMALAPVAFMTDLKSPLKSLAPIASNVAYMEMLYGSHEYFPKNSSLVKMATACIDVENVDTMVCKNVIFYLVGENEKQLNTSLIRPFMANLGTGTSWKTIVHFAQEVLSGGYFQQFDYGINHNQRVYGRDIPPQYDLSKITLPMTLFWSKNDLFCSEKDVKLLHSYLPADTTEMVLIEDEKFNHLDYIMAIDAPTMVNDKILERLKKNAVTEVSVKFTFGK